MGVLGLWQILESVGHPIKIEGLEGKRLGVDANVWLYKFIRGFREKDNVSNLDSHKLGLFNRISKLLFYKIKPIFVFDGPAPVLKRRTLEKRQNVRNKHLAKVQDAAMKLFAEQLKRQYPEANIDNVMIPLPDLRSHNLVAAEKFTDEDRDLFYLPPEINKLSDDDDEDDVVEIKPVTIKLENSVYHIDSDDDVKPDLKPSVDIHSAEFANLPAEIRYEILQDIKESRRRIRRAHALPEDAGSFSNFQMERLRSRRVIQEKIEECERDICSAWTGECNGQTVRSFRMQSDSTSTMLYVQNKASESDTLHPIETKTKGEQQTSSGIDKNAPIPHLRLPAVEIIEIDDSFTDPRPSTSSQSSNNHSQHDSSEDYGTPKKRSHDAEMGKKVREEFAARLYEPSNKKLATIIPTESVEKGGGATEGSAAISEFGAEKLAAPRPKPTIIDADTEVSKPESRATDSSSKEAELLIAEDSEPYKVVNTEKACLVQMSAVPADLQLNPTDQQVQQQQQQQQTIQRNTHNLHDRERFVELDIGVEIDTQKSFVAGVANGLSTCKQTSQSTDRTNVAMMAPTSDSSNDSIDSFGKMNALISRPTGHQSTEPNIIIPATNISLIDIDSAPATPQDSTYTEGATNKARESEITLPTGDNLAGPSKTNQVTHKMVEEAIDGRHKMSAPILQDSTYTEGAINTAHNSEIIPPLRENPAGPSRTNKVTHKIVEEAKELLRLFGIPYIDAAGEAEAQCALLEKLKLTDGTITDDSDVWLFGAQNVYRYFFSDDKYVMQYKMTDIEFHIRMTRENLVCFAMMVGSDYTDGIMNIGPVTALEVLSEFSGEHMEPLVKFKNWKVKYESSKDRIPGSKKREKLLKFRLPEDFPSKLVFDGYMRPLADSSSEKFTWGTPELDELREYARRNFGWDIKKIDEKLLPVMKKLSERKSQPTIDSFFFKTAANQNPELFRSKRINEALDKIAKTTSQNEVEEIILTEDEDSDKSIDNGQINRVKGGTTARGKKSAARGGRKGPAAARSKTTSEPTKTKSNKSVTKKGRKVNGK